MNNTNSTNIIRVLVVDDSPLMQELITDILMADPLITVIETASNGEEAVIAVQKNNPDVITMDYHMPKMNGLEATREIMEISPTPIIIVSGTIMPNESITAFRILEAGALAVVGKPVSMSHPEHQKYRKELVQAVKAIAEIKVVTRRTAPDKNQLPQKTHLPPNIQEIKLIAIGASTGGPIVLQTILSGLAKDFPVPLLIVQHIATGFTQGLVDWLTQSTGFSVRLAASGEKPQPGYAYVAPDGFQMGIGANGCLVLNDNAIINGHRPSVASLFLSVAQSFGSNAIGVLLTGMGKDGANELKLMKDQGALTIAQNKESAVIFGMPGEAIQLGAATMILNPEEIIDVLTRLTKKPSNQAFPG